MVERKRLQYRAVITFAYNTTSIGLYMQYGMYPRESLYRMVGTSTPAESIKGDMKPFDYERFQYEQLQDAGDSLTQLRHIDERVLGFSRDRHHEVFLASQGVACYLIRKHGIPAGYAYLWSDGQIGPLAVVSPESLKDVITTVINIASAQGVNYISVTVPGCSEQAIEIALGHKLRITEPYLLMSSKPFGNWSAYLFHSSVLM